VGIDARRDAVGFSYWLTLVGTTLPVALGAGLMYRLGRLFELSRPRRCLLSALVAFCGGWASYATVLNPQATAASLLAAAVACVLFVGASTKPGSVLAILLPAGLLAALAAAVSPWALPLAAPLPLVLLSMPLPTRSKVIGVLLLTIGTSPVVWTHCAWSLYVFGSIIPPTAQIALLEVAGADAEDVSAMSRLSGLAWNLTYSMLSGRGLLINFPLSIVGMVGLVMVLRRHWPAHAKMLAATVLVGVITVVMLSGARGVSRDAGTFAVPAFVVFTPMLLLWCGAVMRRPLVGTARWWLIGAATVGLVMTVVGARGALVGESSTVQTRGTNSEKSREIAPGS
jgi:hypothetical protein